VITMARAGNLPPTAGLSGSTSSHREGVAENPGGVILDLAELTDQLLAFITVGKPAN